VELHSRQTGVAVILPCLPSRRNALVLGYVRATEGTSVKLWESGRCIWHKDNHEVIQLQGKQFVE
jgi:hypothetical protein